MLGCMHALGFLLIIFDTTLLNLCILKSNEKVHEKMVNKLIRSPLSFFDITDSG